MSGERMLRAVPTRRSVAASPRRICEAAGCFEVTREGKPYCPGHVTLHPYVREVLANLEGERNEVARVAREGSRVVDPEGTTAQELLLTLTRGPRTVERLSRELRLPVRAVRGYLEALQRLRQVRIGRTARGSTTAWRLSS